VPKLEDKLPDTFEDHIGGLLKNFMASAPTSSNKEIWAMSKALRQALTDEGYFPFDSYSSSYHLSVVGASCIFELSPKHNGKLKAFAGERVRVVCTGSGPHWNRKFMAKPVSF